MTLLSMRRKEVLLLKYKAPVFSDATKAIYYDIYWVPGSDNKEETPVIWPVEMSRLEACLETRNIV